jgi:DNA-binding LytR/AlgR family response regulator
MVLKVLIADDDPAAAAYLKKTIEEVPEVEVVSTANDGKETIRQVEIHQPDVVFLDIDISPFETLPGEQAQADWGHFGNIVVDGATYKLYAFVFTLCWSRVSYVEFVVGTPAWTAEPKETKGCCQETPAFDLR